MRFILAALLISGCASHDLRALSTLEPVEPGAFRWRTIGDTIYPPTSPRAEAQRLKQLGIVMGMNCPGGYTVETRTVTQKVDAPLGDGLYDIFYTVRCA